MSKTAHQLFMEIVGKPDPDIDLAHAALLIAQEENPEMCPQSYLERLDNWAAQLTSRLSYATAPEHYIAQLNRLMFDELGFRGNIENYHDPRNSLLDQVMDHRQGIPISLSLLYIEIARRVNFNVMGISLPGYFLVKPATRKAEYYIDAFNQGRIMNDADCAEKLRSLYGDSLPLQDSFLAPVDRKQILNRMLYNLKNLYLEKNNHERALCIVDKILHITPESPSELRDRGILHYRLKHFREAIIDLHKYLLYVPNAREAAQIRQMILMLQAQIRNGQSDLDRA